MGRARRRRASLPIILLNHYGLIRYELWSYILLNERVCVQIRRIIQRKSSTSHCAPVLVKTSLQPPMSGSGPRGSHS